MQESNKSRSVNVKNILTQGMNAVSVAQGAVPALSLSHLSDCLLIAATIANFLRSGCPAVQCLDDDQSSKRSEKVLCILRVLAREHEAFVIETMESIKHCELDSAATMAVFARNNSR